MGITLVLLAFVLSAAFFASGAFAAPVAEGGPDRSIETESLGDLLARADADGRSTHVIFVHGMRAEGPGTSAAFRAALCRHIGGRCPDRPDRVPLRLNEDEDDWPANAELRGRKMWRSKLEWDASQPFLDRYRFTRAGKPDVLVDEVNWWPLLFSLKCRFLVLPETDLSGVDRKHVELCGKAEKPFYDWLSPLRVSDVLANRPRSGGGAWGNAFLKHQIMNWGLGDAVIALGPMRSLVRRSMNAAFAAAAPAPGSEAEEELVIISESLGSFAVLDAFTVSGSPVQEALARSYHLYFLANQFALLELARIEQLPDDDGAGFLSDAAEAPPSPLRALAAWGETRARGLVDHPKQVIAFSDPSDLLTYAVPDICDPDVRTAGECPIRVVNVYVRNGLRFLGLVANPLRAHTRYSSNKAVLKAMFRRSPGSRGAEQ